MQFENCFGESQCKHDAAFRRRKYDGHPVMQTSSDQMSRFTFGKNFLARILSETASFLLPLWEKVARIDRCATDEGFVPRRQTPHPASLREATLSHKGRG
jgi:hypothetical protein